MIGFFAPLFARVELSSIVWTWSYNILLRDSSMAQAPLKVQCKTEPSSGMLVVITDHSNGPVSDKDDDLAFWSIFWAEHGGRALKK
ncbi:hypothetical protein [uncultured Cohaesibacter sp.]|uniref:hypothetical protein n=1 Tax=uncultured Cohaesibacter sp. TaxID=1002546 RepID=UPI0029C8EAE3|nr:hypothetical protein [uncultured Cohaesibacter sp.]